MEYRELTGGIIVVVSALEDSQSIKKGKDLMSPEFKAWIVEQFVDSVKPDEKQNFLRFLKHHPDQVLGFIFDNLEVWSMRYCLQTGKPVIVHSSRDSVELLEAYQEYFANELAAISAPTS